MVLSRIACYVQNFEDFGIFIGIFLSQKNIQKEKDYEKYRKSPEFKNLITKEISEFLSRHENTKAELEIYFNR